MIVMRNFSKSLVFACALSSCLGSVPPLNRASSGTITPLTERHFDSSSTYLPCGTQGERVLRGIDRNMTFAQISQELNTPVPDVIADACCLMRHNLISSPALAPVCGL